VGGTASRSRPSVNHMGGNPTIPRRTIAWRKRAFGAPEPARATSGAQLVGEPEWALAKDADALASHVGVYPLNESDRGLIELLESDELTCSL